MMGVVVSLGSSAIAGVLPSAWLRFLSADAAELGTRLIIGLIPDVLPGLLLNRSELESLSFDMGVGGTERFSSARVKAWSTTDRRPWSSWGDARDWSWWNCGLSWCGAAAS